MADPLVEILVGGASITVATAAVGTWGAAYKFMRLAEQNHRDLRGEQGVDHDSGLVGDMDEVMRALTAVGLLPYSDDDFYRGGSPAEEGEP